MGEHPGDVDRSPGTEDENARLELPSLRLPRFGRRRKPRDDEETAVPPAEPPSPASQPTATQPTATHPTATQPTATQPTPPEPEPLPDPAPEPLPQPDPAPQRVLVVDRDVSGHTRETPATEPHEPATTAPGETAPDEATDDSDDDQHEEPAARQPFAFPSLPARIAVVVTGAVVGAVGVALTYASLQGCNAVRGTKSCGGGTGLLLLVVILVLMALLGAVLLTLWHVPEARGTSLLGVGVLAVVVLLTSMQQLDSVWTFLVVPVICAVSYLLAHWVTTAFVELPDQGPQHDIR